MSEREVITVQDEEGHTHEFTLVDVLDVDAHRYAILQPADDDTAVVFRIEDDSLVTIDDDAEFERVLEAIETSDDYGEVRLFDGNRPVHPKAREPGPSG